MKDKALERSEAYLEGRLSAEETDRFERDLLLPEVAAAFRETLLLKELLQNLPPREAPAGLVEKIEDTLRLDGAFGKEKKKAPGRKRWARLRAVLKGSSWVVKGTAIAVEAPVNALETSSNWAAGLSTIRYALGPLAQSEVKTPNKKSRLPLWSRVVRFSRRRLSKRSER